MTITVEINATTGEEISREMNEEEQLVHDAYVKKEKEKASKIEADRIAKAAARQAILDRLGITADEAALLFA
jgi:hypothetical protein